MNSDLTRCSPKDMMQVANKCVKKRSMQLVMMEMPMKATAASYPSQMAVDKIHSETKMC